MPDFPAPTPHGPLRCWAEIDLAALAHNLEVVRERIGSEAKLMAIVKADAYGHGLGGILTTLGQYTEYFGVANLGEALDVRAVWPDAEILLLGATLPEERESVVRHGFMPAISSMEEAEMFSRLGPTRVHLAVDSGMGRLGFLPEEWPAALEKIRAMPNLQIEAVATHLPSADEDEAFTLSQLEAYHALTSEAPSRHMLNSAGIINFSTHAAQFVRAGLMLYGASPVPEFQGKLRPVMTLKSRVTLIRTLPAGHGVSYGRSFVTKAPTRVATISAGYADGYQRRLSNRGAHVLLRDQRCPVLGRVTMDQIMIDVTDVPAEIGDEVELFGTHILAGEIAQLADTIPWEILTGISKRVPRIFLQP
ncbi:MAG TPA: alanine racemase [Chthoniobacterales bacterium]